MPAEMNEHIRQGNLALNAGDRDRAATEFYEALEDPDPLTQRIARNRLMELFPETVFAKTHSYQSLYNRPNWRRQECDLEQSYCLVPGLARRRQKVGSHAMCANPCVKNRTCPRSRGIVPAAFQEQREARCWFLNPKSKIQNGTGS